MVMSNKTIVAALALDGDDDPIVARAVQLATQHDARVDFIHVKEDLGSLDAISGGSLVGGTVRALIEKETSDRLYEVIGAANVPVPHTRLVAEGKPFETIIRRLQDPGTMLLVIGPGKAGTLREKVLGSTADHLVRSAPVPVITVRLRRAAPYSRVIVAASLSPQSIAASSAVRSIAQNAQINHIHVVEMPLPFEQSLLRAGTSQATIARYHHAKMVAARKQLESAFAVSDNQAVLKMRLIRGDARRAMARHARDRQIELIALGTHDRSVVSQVLLGSVAREVLQAALCDVLTVSTYGKS